MISQKVRCLYVDFSFRFPKKKGTYDSTKAVKLWQYMIDDAAKRYEKEYGTPGIKTFSTQDRKMVAISFAKDFEERYDDGEFDD